MSHSINIENLYRAGISIAFAVRSFDLFTRLILWIEERDSDQKVLLAERINPTGIMARYQDFLPCAGKSYSTMTMPMRPNNGEVPSDKDRISETVPAFYVFADELRLLSSSVGITYECVS